MRRELLAYVNRIENNIICITSYSQNMIKKLTNIGFSKGLIIRPKNQEELLKKIGAVRDMNIPFASHHKGPSPEDYLCVLQEKGLFVEKYKIIYWSSLSSCNIYEVDELGSKHLVEHLSLLPQEIAKLQDNSLIARLLRFIFNW